MKRKKSSQRWLQRQATDPYVKQAQQAGYRSRAAFKLLEMQRKDQFLAPGMSVIDLGGAPGSWSQVARQIVGGQGKVITVDILPITPMKGVIAIQGDITEEAVLKDISQQLGDNKVDVVLSDMAPNLSGIAAVDQAKMMNLVEMALEMVLQCLKSEGVFLTKLFQGEGFDNYLASVKRYFKKVVIRKPKASREGSREVYLLGKGFLGAQK